jgi:hypothetical protein
VQGVYKDDGSSKELAGNAMYINAYLNVVLACLTGNFYALMSSQGPDQDSCSSTPTHEMLGEATGIDDKAILFFGALHYCMTMDVCLFTPWVDWPRKLRGDERASESPKGRPLAWISSC